MNEAKRVLALGFFDGVHRGHGALLRQARALAAELDAAPACLTFDRHPGDLLGQPAPLINTAAERRWLMTRRFGMAEVLTLPFDEALMHTPWEAFAARLLTEFRAAGLVCGADYRFGDRGAGSAALLRDYAAAQGVPCRIVPPVYLGGAPVSSTRIRAALEAGQLAEANELLGRPHLLTGVVEHGKHLGSQLGFPTANLAIQPGVLAPRRGVYAAWVTLPGGERRMSVTNIGLRPTVERSDRMNVESWLLHYKGNLYGQPLQVELMHFLRPETRFESAEALRQQVLSDGDTAQLLLEEDTQ